MVFVELTVLPMQGKLSEQLVIFYTMYSSARSDVALLALFAKSSRRLSGRWLMVIHTCLTKSPKEKFFHSFTTLAFNFLPSLRWVCFYFGAARGKLSGMNHIIAEKFICCWYWEIISLAFLGMFNLGINHEGNSQFTTAGDLIPKFMLSPLSLGRVVFCTFWNWYAFW